MLKEVEDILKDPNLKKRPLNKKMFTQAVALLRSSQIIEQEIVKAFSEEKTQDDRIELAYSLIILRSFATELLLKCLIIIDYDQIMIFNDLSIYGIKKPKDHDLITLYNSIPQNHKRTILKIYHQKDSTVIDEDSVKDKIQKIGSDPFVYWRYIYEKPENHEIDLKELNTFNQVLFESIQEIKK